MKLSFGEHTNEEISRVSTPYLKHVLKAVDLSPYPGLKEAIEIELASRPKKESDTAERVTPRGGPNSGR